MSHIVSDIVAGVGAPWDHSKSSKSMFFDKNQWKSMIFMESAIFVTELTFGIAAEWYKVPKIHFFIKKRFFLRNENMSHIVSDVVAGVGAPRDHSKS